MVEKTGNLSIMKFTFFLFLLSSLLCGGNIPVHCTFSSNPTVALRILDSAFTTMGYRLDTDMVQIQDGSGELSGRIIGYKPLSINALAEVLSEHEIHIQKGRLDTQGLSLDLDTQNAKWSLPMITQEEGVELKRVNNPQWFRIEEVRQIKIASPYEGKWYPEIAVLSVDMEVLYTFQSSESKEEIAFALPEGSFYLMVSNVQGMKVLKEGMWIESLNISR